MVVEIRTIKDLDERINEQNINIKESTENNYKNIVKK